MSDSTGRISPEYLKTQKEMHIGLHRNMQYGSIAHILYPIIENFIVRINPKTIFDYGCGKQYLKKPIEKMGIEYTGYDPAIKKYSTFDLSKKHDLVICIDVMEHVEVEYQDIVLNDISKLASAFVVFTISPTPAKKVLSDGRNAHICQAGPSYWLPKICKYFEPIQMANCVEGVSGFYVICSAKKKTPKINQMGTHWDGDMTNTRKLLKDAGLQNRLETLLSDSNQILKEN